MGRDCIFCTIVAGAAPASLVWEDDNFVAFLDIHPMSPGHALVVPRSHVQRVAEMTPEDCGRLLALGRDIAEALRRSDVPCEDVHFVLNDGPAANQTVPHVHLHVVPRRRGDLARFLANLAALPLAPLRRPAPRARLDETAARIRAQLP